MRPGLPFALIVLGLVSMIGLLGREAAPASACSIAPLYDQRDTPGNIEDSDVVAAGTLQGTRGDAVTLLVDQGLKGAAAGDRLTINNATNLDCYEGVEAGRQNYKTGDHVLVFLIPDAFGVAQYKVHRFGWDIFRIDGDALRPYLDFGQPAPLQRIEDVRAAFRSAAATPYDPSLESTLPCKAAGGRKPTDAGQWANMAEAMVIATVVGERDGATVLRVDEEFKGGLHGEITLNDHYLNVDETHRCELSLREQRAWWPPSRRVAALLVRDELGVAEWRGAALGSAVWSINSSDFVRFDGIPLLSEVRQATTLAGFQPGVAQSPAATSAAGAPQPEPVAGPQPSPGRSDGNLPLVPLAIAAGLAVALLALAAWLRVRR